MQVNLVLVDLWAQLQPGRCVRWRFCLGPEVPTGPRWCTQHWNQEGLELGHLTGCLSDSFWTPGRWESTWERPMTRVWVGWGGMREGLGVPQGPAVPRPVVRVFVLLFLVLRVLHCLVPVGSYLSSNLKNSWPLFLQIFFPSPPHRITLEALIFLSIWLLEVVSGFSKQDWFTGSGHVFLSGFHFGSTCPLYSCYPFLGHCSFNLRMFDSVYSYLPCPVQLSPIQRPCLQILSALSFRLSFD